MNKRMSYNESMKDMATRKQNSQKIPMTDVYSQMILDEAWFKLKKVRLENLIDQALDDRNRDLFMRLSEEYKNFMQAW
jgi:uncharacterized protein YpiB (UPF0302 family)